LKKRSRVDGSVEVVQFCSTVRNDSRREIYSRESLASTASCAHLYTCPFWISVRLYLRERSKSDKQSEVFPRENKTKVNYNKLDY